MYFPTLTVVVAFFWSLFVAQTISQYHDLSYYTGGGGVIREVCLFEDENCRGRAIMCCGADCIKEDPHDMIGLWYLCDYADAGNRSKRSTRRRRPLTNSMRVVRRVAQPNAN